jgi:8-oxo-dGTP pyrophosphatase MutT (NUDIX family)
MTATGLKRTAVLCILRHGDELLLMRRTKTLPQGLYVPVGGKVDPYEGPKAAALREVHEEAGVVLSDAQFCGVMVETPPATITGHFIYIATFPAASPFLRRGRAEWVPWTPQRLPLLYSTASSIRTSWRPPLVFDVIYDAEIRILSDGRELAQGAPASGGDPPAVGALIMLSI